MALVIAHDRLDNSIRLLPLHKALLLFTTNCFKARNFQLNNKPTFIGGKEKLPYNVKHSLPISC